MPKVIKFPAPQGKPAAPAAPRVDGTRNAGNGTEEMASPAHRAVWVVAVLLWPVLRYVVILDCVFQLFRMIWYWNTPGMFAGFRFLLHFAVLVGLTWFVSVHKPKGA
jgi:hypothetical protein